MELIFWVYTNSGIKVGQFGVDGIDWSTEAGQAISEQMIAKTLYLWCVQEGLDPEQHNCCVAGK